MAPIKSNFLKYGAVYLIAFLFGLTQWHIPPLDPDLGWHLMGGKIIVEQRTVPLSDPINAFKSRWIDYSWIVQPLFYTIYRNFDLTGLRILYGILMAFVGVLLVHAVSSLQHVGSNPHKPFEKGNNHIPMIALVLGTLGVLCPLLGIRPQAFAVILILSSLIRLWQKERQGEKIVLFMYTILCANTHVYWCFIPLFYFIYRILCATHSVSDSYGKVKRYLALFLMAGAGIFTPYGIAGLISADKDLILSNYFVLLDYNSLDPALKNAIAELKGIFLSGGWLPWWVLILSSLLARYHHFKASGYGAHYIVVATLAYMTANSVKFGTVLAVAVLPLAYEVLEKFWHEIKSYLKGVPINLILIACIMFLAHMSYQAFPRKQDEMFFYNHLPFKACRYLKSIEANKPILVMTSFDYGGWCAFSVNSAPGEVTTVRVTTDSRTTFIPLKHFRNIYSIYNLRMNWRELLGKFRPDFILVSEQDPLLAMLWIDKLNYKLVEKGGAFYLFEVVR